MKCMMPDKGFWACLGDLPPDMPSAYTSASTDAGAALAPLLSGGIRKIMARYDEAAVALG